MYSTPESPNVKHCEWCGEVLPPNRKRFCNKKCNSAWRSANYRIEDTYICKGCGIEFNPKAKNRTEFHSRECAFAYKNRLKMERAERIKADSPRCEVCGKEARSAWSKDCGSKECKRTRYLEKAAANSTRDRSPRACVICGTIFTPEYGDFRRDCCGDAACKKTRERLHRGKEGKSFNARARSVLRKKYGEKWKDHYEPINRRKVLQRDGWKCKLCGCKLKRTKQWHEQQATVDHIVPLARGGAHKYVNVQAACMMCNSNKGAKAKGQMRLIG